MQYSAYYVEEKDGAFSASISKLELKKPEDGFVQIKVSHSSLNYKDALSASGNKGVTRNYPHSYFQIYTTNMTLWQQ